MRPYHAFGVHRITRVKPIAMEDLDDLANQIGDLTRERVKGRSRLYGSASRQPRGPDGCKQSDASAL